MSDTDVSQSELKNSLKTVLTSQTFSGADRLQGFLRYVVEETIEGRASGIRGKTIALDVYERNASSDGDPENVVRVDARRLRRRLSDYYEQEGQADPIRIHIDSGGYAPRFERVKSSSPVPETQRPVNNKRWAAVGAFAASSAIILSVFFLWSGFQNPILDDAADLKKLERQALLEKSPTALQAVNLAEQGKGMIFPLFDVERQKLTLGMFEQAVRLDPEFFGGYAGAAFSLATLALLSQDPDQTAAYLNQASDRVNKSIGLNPTAAWTQATSAWVAFAEGDHEKAQELSRRAYAMNQGDWYVSDVHGLVSLFTGNFIEARKVSDPEAASAVSSLRSGNRNIYAAANFHLGEYQKTLTALKEIGELGGPVAPPRLAYQSAAKHALGDLEGARTAALELTSTWPNFRVDTVLLSFFSSPIYADDVVARLQDVGWAAQQ